MSEKIVYTIQDNDVGERLDVVVVRALEGKAGRARVKKLFTKGLVRVADRVATKGWRARKGDTLTIEAGTFTRHALADTAAPLDVRLERQDLVVVSKPAGQPTAPIEPGERGTLVNALLGRYPEMRGVGYGPQEPGILHRLDTDTSGLVLAARKQEAFDVLVQALREANLQKEYLLICRAAGLAETGTIEIPIGVAGKQSKRVVACVEPEQQRRYQARPARTIYRIVDTCGEWALVNAQAPKAVRHQLRAHFAAIDHPLAGDKLYGGKQEALGRQALHASMIAWNQPGLESFHVTQELPNDMKTLMDECLL